MEEAVSERAEFVPVLWDPAELLQWQNVLTLRVRELDQERARLRERREALEQRMMELEQQLAEWSA